MLIFTLKRTSHVPRNHEDRLWPDYGTIFAVPGKSADTSQGHEFVGIIESVGSEVHSVKPGDRVVCIFSTAWFVGIAYHFHPHTTSATNVCDYHLAVSRHAGSVRVATLSAALML